MKIQSCAANFFEASKIQREFSINARMHKMCVARERGGAGIYTSGTAVPHIVKLVSSIAIKRKWPEVSLG